MEDMTAVVRWEEDVLQAAFERWRIRDCSVAIHGVPMYTRTLNTHTRTHAHAHTHTAFIPPFPGL